MNGVKCKDFFKPEYKDKICGILRMIFMHSIFNKKLQFLLHLLASLGLKTICSEHGFQYSQFSLFR